jgi:hypothetical protein
VVAALVAVVKNSGRPMTCHRAAIATGSHVMRSDLDHLPANKRELERVVQIIFEEFEDALALASHEWKKKGRILKVILYGSYARGGWVDEPTHRQGLPVGL